jgi:hypothetical protein
MNEELRAALELVGDLHYQRGANNARGIVCAPPNADILAAEAAVVAIFEAREANRSQLAEALRAVNPLLPLCSGVPTADYVRVTGILDDALAAYAALEARG